MPFARPTLGQLTDAVNQDLIAANPGIATLLRTSMVGVLARVLGKATHLMFSYLDWIARQAVPWSATDENLVGWAALRGITRQPASTATGTAVFSGSPNALIPANTVVRRVSDQVAYVVTADTYADASGNAVVPLAGQTVGATSNTPVGTILSVSGVAGITSAGTSGAITGGGDAEGDTSLRARTLAAFASPPQGGSATDYVVWAREVAGVSRAWVNPQGVGAGSVVVYCMLDGAEAFHGGFPVGTDGVAPTDPRGPAATGDQLRVATHIDAVRPVTAYVYVAAPVPCPIAVTLSNLSTTTQAQRDAITAALVAMFTASADPLGSPIFLSQLTTAISGVAGVVSFGIAAPTNTIVAPLGQLPVLGTLTFA